MKRTLFVLFAVFFYLSAARAQPTTITTTATSFDYWNGMCLTFAIGNTNSYDIILTDLSNYAPVSQQHVHALVPSYQSFRKPSDHKHWEWMGSGSCKFYCFYYCCWYYSDFFEHEPGDSGQYYVSFCFGDGHWQPVLC